MVALSLRTKFWVLIRLAATPDIAADNEQDATMRGKQHAKGPLDSATDGNYEHSGHDRYAWR